VLKKGKRHTVITEHRLGDKTIADVCEALIGAALLANYGTGDMDNAVRAVTELVCSADHTMTTYAEYFEHYELPSYQTAPATVGQRDLVRKLETEHPYHFNYPRLARSAFIHPSYPYSFEHVPNYQRLEFLGDSLLDMACIDFLFHRFPDRDPHWLTEHKMAMVSNQFLGALCVSLGFHKHLLSFSTIIASNIGQYVTAITDARIQAEDDAESAGKARSEFSRDFWVSVRLPPKCLPDLVEAYVGAIFVDSGYNYNEVERFFAMHIKPYFEDMSIYDTFANKHPVTFLTNIMNTTFGCTNWTIHAKQLDNIGDGLPSEIVATVMIHDEIVADKQGVSARYAKISVANQALELLTGLPLTEFRARFGCDCKIDDDGEVIEVTEEAGHGTAI
jgi:endoribonuclease Dicer